MEIGVNDLGQQELSARVGQGLWTVYGEISHLGPQASLERKWALRVLVGPGEWGLFSTELDRNLHCVALLEQDQGVGKVCLGWLSCTCCISCPLPSSLSSVLSFPIFLIPLITLQERAALTSTLININD